jgi:hypothetical protein
MMHPLYIDPGTGSILFSLFIGLAAAMYFMARTLIIKTKYLFTGKSVKSADYHSFVVYNEGIQYWPVFRSILDEFEKRRINLLYLTSAEDDPVFVQSYQYVTAEYIGKGNKAFTRLNFLNAGICLMTTPGIEVFQLKRSKGVKHYSHILHDTGDVTCYRLFGIDWFDSILLSGEYQIKDIRKLEEMRSVKVKELPVIGSTYLDVYKEKAASLQKEMDHRFTVLVSPSWGSGALLSAFGQNLIDPLINTGWRIIIRPHPQSKTSEASLILNLESRYKDNSLVEWDYNPENIVSLSRADVMISDFSGIIFDFAFLFDKPVLFANSCFNKEMYDAGDLEHHPWKFEVVKSFCIELQQTDMKNIKTVIENVVNNPKLTNERQRAKETAWQNEGKAAQAAVDFLVTTKERLEA